MKKLVHNWKLKLTSVLLALISWVAIMNTADPVEPYTYSNIPINVINDQAIRDAGKSYTVDGKLSASVRVQASHSVVNSLKASDFTAVADISRMFDLTGQVPVEVTCSNRNISSSQITLLTNSVRLVIEDIQTKHFVVEVRTTGEPAEDYVLGRLTASPYSVSVKAPVSVIEKIARVGVVIPVDNLSESVTQKAEIQYYREDGSILNSTILGAKDTTFSDSQVNVSVEVLSVKSVPIVISGVSDKEDVTGGFRYTGHNQSVKTVQVSGFTSLLADMNAITIPAEDISVAGASEDRDIELDLKKYLPEGIEIVSGQPETVVVTLKVEPLVMRTVDVRDILTVTGTNGRYLYDFAEEPVIVTVSALEDEFTGFSPESLSAVVDLGGLTPGEHDVPVAVSCTESVFEITNVETIRVSVREAFPQPSDEETYSEIGEE